MIESLPVFKVTTPIAGIYNYQYLPELAKAILQDHVHEFAKEQLQLARKYDVPLLKFLTQFTEAELIQISEISIKEYMGYLSENRAADQIKASTEKWISNQMEVVGKYDIVAEDITLLTHIRGKSLKNYAFKLFNNEQQQDLINEIDDFLLASTTTSANTYISILKDQITLRETQLLEAQSIGHIGSFEWDITGKNTVCTPEVYKIFELDALEGYDKFMQHVHKDDLKMVEAAISESMSSGVYQCIYRYVKSTEKVIWSQGIVKFQDNFPVTMVGTVQDVTLIKKMEKELIKQAEELRQSNESLQQFAAIASHDLKEPLRKISIHSNKVLTQEKVQIKQESLASLNTIYSSTIRLQKMIDNLLEFSFISGEQASHETNLNILLDEVKEILSEAIEDNKGKLIYSKLPTIRAVPSQMKQLFQNLISNALKFSKHDVAPVIKISHEFSHGFLIIKVQDNGIGFNKVYEEKIFQLFYRLHNRSEYEGSGLGLSICKKIMEKHNGTIMAESNDEGALFTLKFPEN